MTRVGASGVGAVAAGAAPLVEGGGVWADLAAPDALARRAEGAGERVNAASVSQRGCPEPPLCGCCLRHTGCTSRHLSSFELCLSAVVVWAYCSTRPRGRRKPPDSRAKRTGKVVSGLECGCFSPAWPRESRCGPQLKRRGKTSFGQKGPACFPAPGFHGIRSLRQPAGRQAGCAPAPMPPACKGPLKTPAPIWCGTWGRSRAACPCRAARKGRCRSSCTGSSACRGA